MSTPEEGRPVTAVAKALHVGELDTLFTEIKHTHTTGSKPRQETTIITETRKNFSEIISKRLEKIALRSILVAGEMPEHERLIDPETRLAIIQKQMDFAAEALRASLDALDRCDNQMLLGELLAQSGSGKVEISVIEHIAAQRMMDFLNTLIQESLDLIADNPVYTGPDSGVSELLVKLRDTKTIAKLHLGLIAEYDRVARKILASDTLDIATKVAEANRFRESGLEVIEIIIEAQLAPILEHPKARDNLKKKIDELRQRLGELKKVLTHTRISIKNRQ